MRDDERRQRFVDYFQRELKGDRARLMAKTGLTKGRVSQLFKEDQPFGEKAAAALAEKLGLPGDYFDGGMSFTELDPYEASLITAFRLLPETDKRALLMHVNERVRGNQGIGQTDEVEAAGEDVPLTREQSNKPRESETSWQRKPQFGRPVQTTNHPDFPDKIYSAEAKPAHKVAGRRKGGKQQ